MDCRGVRTLFACCVAGFFACTTNLTEPEADGLRLTAEISTPTVNVGQTALLTFRLQNLTAESVTLSFGGGCQIVPFIETAAGVVVNPPNGSYACLAVITKLELAPHGERAITQEVRGGVPQIAIYTSVPLPPGDYRAYAILHPNSRLSFELRSDAVSFSVR